MIDPIELLAAHGIEADLKHYGVKGMHWGVRKAAVTPESMTPSERAARISVLEKQEGRLDGNRIVEGLQLQGWKQLKQLKRNQRRGLDVTSREVRQRANRSARRSIALRGATEIAAILVGANLGINAMNLSPSTARGGKISSALLAGQAGRMRVHQINSLRIADRHLDIHEELYQLRKAQRKQPR